MGGLIVIIFLLSKGNFGALAPSAKWNIKLPEANTLIQDDGENKHEQISAMDVIYSASILTIIAASGAGANDGLPGLAPGSRTAIQHIEEVQDGLKLTNRLPTVPEGVD